MPGFTLWTQLNNTWEQVDVPQGPLRVNGDDWIKDVDGFDGWDPNKEWKDSMEKLSENVDTYKARWALSRDSFADRYTLLSNSQKALVERAVGTEREKARLLGTHLDELDLAMGAFDTLVENWWDTNRERVDEVGPQGLRNDFADELTAALEPVLRARTLVSNTLASFDEKLLRRFAFSFSNN